MADVLPANPTLLRHSPRRSGAPTVELGPLFWPARRDELGDPAQLLVDVDQPGGSKEGRDRGAVEDPHSADRGAERESLAHQGRLAAVTGEYHDAMGGYLGSQVAVPT